MGACCSKHGGYGNAPISNMCDEIENEYEQENYVLRGDFGASIRLDGFSAFTAMATQQGKKGINQDAMTVWEDFTGEKDAFFCGVFDGHGPCGHKVSRYIRDHLPAKLSAAHKLIQSKPQCMNNIETFDEDENDACTANGEAIDNLRVENDSEANRVLQSWKAGLLKSFKETDRELSLDPFTETYVSGSTAVTVVKQGDHLIVGNLGDSRAVMCTRGEKGQITPVQLTVDLKPSLPREAERVKRCSGRVFSLEEETHVVRIWLPDQDSPGLAMTRAFGDYCLKDYGLICTPQVFYRRLTEQDEFIVLATDGVWDVLTNFEVVRIVSASRKRSHAAEFLVAHAVRAWKSRFPTSRADDITVVCLFLKAQHPRKSMSDLSHTTNDSLSNINSSISQNADEGFESGADPEN